MSSILVFQILSLQKDMIFATSAIKYTLGVLYSAPINGVSIKTLLYIRKHEYSLLKVTKPVNVSEPNAQYTNAAICFGSEAAVNPNTVVLTFFNPRSLLPGGAQTVELGDKTYRGPTFWTIHIILPYFLLYSLNAVSPAVDGRHHTSDRIYGQKFPITFSKALTASVRCWGVLENLTPWPKHLQQ